MPDDPIKTLWERLPEVQHISAAGGDPLTNAAIKDLTFLLLESTGMFTTAFDTWCVCPIANQMLIKFCLHFTSKNKECLHKLTTGQLGYHSANAAIVRHISATQVPHVTPVPQVMVPPAVAAQVSLGPTIPMPACAITTDDGLQMYYCWMHGLGFNQTHTSTSCSNLAEGHCTTATVKNMQGGNNTIMSNRCRQLEKE